MFGGRGFPEVHFIHGNSLLAASDLKLKPLTCINQKLRINPISS